MVCDDKELFFGLVGSITVNDHDASVAFLERLMDEFMHVEVEKGRVDSDMILLVFALEESKHVVAKLWPVGEG